MTTTITDAHFGLNFVADYERIGSKPWERFDDIVSRLDINYLRYPGGTSAETVFDYRNPNATSFTTSQGEILKLTPLEQYIAYCNQNGINPTIIVPTAVLLSNQSKDGQRSFDQAQTQDLQNFIEQVLHATDPNLQLTFELGNEYETYMTSIEYGRIANSVTGIINDAYMSTQSNLANSGGVAEPNIVIQAWAYSVSAGLTNSELDARNAQVISQFSSENLEYIDGVSSHYYYSDGRNAGSDQAQSFESISDQINRIASLHSEWESATNRQLTSIVSEWNVLFRSTSELGLRQIGPLMEMFTSFLRNDFDALDFWSAQYHATSIADSSGRMMAAGSLWALLKPEVVGTELGEATYTDQITSYTFEGPSHSVGVITSNEEGPFTYSLNLEPNGRILVNGYIIGVDESTADGLYRNLVGLQPYSEPDARITTTQLSMSFITGSQIAVTLDPYETLILVYNDTDQSRATVYGTDYADVFHGSGSPTLFIGGNSWDTVYYTSASSGISVDLQMDSPRPDWAGDVYVSVEMLVGSTYGDSIGGTSQQDFLHGMGGDDVIFGQDGNDNLNGGVGDDTLFGGLGDDQINGDIGDDWFYPSGGADTISGGDGDDVLSFSDYSSGVNVWAGNGVVETQRGIVSIREVEVFVGSNSNDFLDAALSTRRFDGLDGDDVFTSRVIGYFDFIGGLGDDTFFFYAGSGSVCAGDGNDSGYVYDGSVEFSGGAGNDTVYSFKGGNRLEGGLGDDRFYALGRGDEFIFSGEEGKDVVMGFQSGTDAILVRSDLASEVRFEQSEEGSTLVFSSESSVTFIGNWSLGLDDIMFF